MAEMIINATTGNFNGVGHSWGMPLSYNYGYSPGWSATIGGHNVEFEGDYTVQTDLDGNPIGFTMTLTGAFTVYDVNGSGERVVIGSGTMPPFSYTSTLSDGDYAQLDGNGNWTLGIHGETPASPLGPFGQFIAGLDDIAFNGSGAADVFDGSYLDVSVIAHGNNGADGLYGAFRHSNQLYGGGGNDQLIGQGVRDLVDGGTGNDFITDGDNYGDSTLPPPQDTYDSDTLVGGGGNDTVLGTGGGDLFDGGAGNDLLSANTGTEASLASDDTLLGGTGLDVLLGGGGNDFLSGGAGADDMDGGDGDDTYTVDHADDLVIEGDGPGHDLVRTSVGYTLGGNVEDLLLIGTSKLTGIGNNLANLITGNSGSNTVLGLGGNDTLIGWNGNDTIDGGAGSDEMDGGVGNDTFLVNAEGDVVIEAAAQGSDLVQSSISYTLVENVEKLILLGSGNIQGGGNSLANVLTGNVGRNNLSGLGGKDSISGGDGNDTLAGGQSADRLTGGVGVDQFVFLALSDSTTKAGGRDTITDFSATDGDRINLAALDADTVGAGDQAFTYIGAAAFTGHAGELVASIVTGGTLISGDVNGDRRADFSILLDGQVTLEANSFLL
ncbi:calcium-binding protein [Paracoccus litorisediminis]|uniref:calcium-binding protein n=1 Tax=Paracoccus litorisediminis TaxID=2006130 RepID=UPI0037326D55